MAFIPSFESPENISETDMWFLFHEQKLLIKGSDPKHAIIRTPDLQVFNLDPVQQQYLGQWNGTSCYAAELSVPKRIPDLKWIGIREVFTLFEKDMIQVAGIANQLVHWNKKHRYCGNCGKRTEDKNDERAKICPACGSIYYPRLSPAMIVAVTKDKRILLAHSKRFPGRFYSTLAGFVEPGETLEECVKREVREEVGIFVRNIRYFGSQPWPYPDSLMIAFTAEYAGGDIHIDNTEIADAAWFSADNLPAIPPRISIARQLIDWFSLEWCGNEKQIRDE